MAEGVQEKIESNINSLIFQLQGGLLILPDMAVAEIVDYQKVQQLQDHQEGDEAWFLGRLSWRDRDVALISFDALDQQRSFEADDNAKIVVVNSVAERESFHYWAFVINAAPKMQSIDSEALVVIPDVPLGEVTVALAELLGETVIIPDLEKIEGLIASIKNW